MRSGTAEADYARHSEKCSAFAVSPGRTLGKLNIKLNVDPENKYFCTDDLGVLYNKDKTLLYFCPNLPYTFDYTVRCNLNEYAFSGCENLRND